MKNEINKLRYHLYTSYIFIYLLALLSFYKSSFLISISFLVVWSKFINRLVRKFSTNYKQNRFKQFAILSSLLILFCAVLALLTNGNLLGLILTTYPLLYKFIFVY
jgi:hypothetical protein